MNIRFPILWLTGLLFAGRLAAQQPGGGLQNNPFNTHREGRDSLNRPEKRHEDTIRISFRTATDVVDRGLDSSINDFTHYLPLPADYVYLGNLGTPARDLIFRPVLQPGFDAGFHAMDPYRFDVDSTRYFQTTRPYTQLRYMIGSKQEQLIDVFHTQNPRQNFNFGFRYRKINAPGFFRNQNTNTDGYNVFAHYHTKRQRYHAYLSFAGNKMFAGENGGIVSDSLLADPNYTDRRTIPVHLGGSNPYSSGFFTSPVATKSGLKANAWLFRHHYDWGRGDSVQVNDSTVRYDFYPVFRIEHTLRIDREDARYDDTIPSSASLYYAQHYGLDSLWVDALRARHNWRTISNDLSLVQFPVPENQGQFLRAGATYETVWGQFLQHSLRMHNLKGHFAYHNLTRNRKWDLDAYGELYLLGDQFGDYLARASLSRYLNDKLGQITLGFVNLNQTPPFIYRFFESNRFVTSRGDLNKTNLTRLQFRADNAELRYHLTVNYYLISNYVYLADYKTPDQYSTLFNFLQVVFSKEFRAGHFHWYADLAYQQTGGHVPLHVPQIWTRHRLSYENILFKNLNLCTGAEIRYHTPYYADDYSPVFQQFVSQDQWKTDDTWPDMAAFFDFRIKSFVAYVRAENLNSLLEPNRLEIPHYPYPGFSIRVGIQWSFIN